MKYIKSLILCLSIFVINKAFSQISFIMPKNSIGSIIYIDSFGKAYINGTAFIVGQQQLVVTCNHVIEGQSTGFFENINGEIKSIITSYISPSYDFAVSKFNDNTNYGHWDFGDFKSIKPGDTVIYLGWNSEINSYKVDMAVVSSIGSSKNGSSTADFLEFEGFGIPGYSGGPVMNKNGKVIAVMREAWTKRGIKGGNEVLMNRAFSIEPIKIIEENIVRYK